MIKFVRSLDRFTWCLFGLCAITEAGLLVAWYNAAPIRENDGGAFPSECARWH
jgi:hypothetical protein